MCNFWLFNKKLALLFHGLPLNNEPYLPVLRGVPERAAMPSACHRQMVKNWIDPMNPRETFAGTLRREVRRLP